MTIKEYKVTTTSVCFVEAETEEEAREEFEGRSDYGEIESVKIIEPEEQIKELQGEA